MKRYLLVAIGFLSASVMIAREVPGLGKKSSGKTSGSMKTLMELCQPARAQSDLNINNVRATILGGGDMWWDLNTARYEVPKGSNKHSMFAGALWLGGVDEGNQLKLAAMTYRQRGNDYWPGPLSDDGTASTEKEICDNYDQHWILLREEVEIHKAWLECLDDPDCIEAEEFPGYESQIPTSILEWPGNGKDGELPYVLAPFIDRDGDQFYDPFIDYPAYDIDKEFDCTQKETDILYGDQTIWWVYNDRGNVHTETAAGALGFEIRAQAFAFSTNDEVNNMTFNNYRILNKSTFRLTDTYFSTWFDADLGNAQDDIIGSDIPRGLGYVYNSDANDEGPLGYGLNPPAIGFDFFQGPFADYFDGLDNDRDGCIDGVRNDEGICVPENPVTGINERIIMSGFMYYNNTSNAFSGNPDSGPEFYNYMRSLWRNGFPLVIETPCGPACTGNGDGFTPDGSGEKTLYAYPGNSFDTTGTTDPIVDNNWFESPANQQDKRGLHNAGPFSLAPGALNFITTGAVWERDQINDDLFASVEKVIVADDKAQQLFDNCFRVLDGPDAPDMNIQELDEQLIISLSYRGSSNNFKYKYIERDPLITLPPGEDLDDILADNPFYFDYIFEGFQIFQLANEDVPIGDIYLPNQSRLVAQVDVKNGITQLINWTVDPDLNQLVPQDMTLESNDAGINNSFTLTEDVFATGDRSLINHKEYYFTVIAYGQNQYEKFDPTTAPTGQKIPFLAGRRNISTYTAIPHLTESEAGGTVINAQYGSGPLITRIDGVGNGGNVLELTDASEDTIVSQFSVKYPVYKEGAGPVNIKVVDPLAIPVGKFTIAFTTSGDNSNWWIEDEFRDTIASSDTNISFFNEQIVAELGISVTLEQPENPGGDDDGVRNNGVQESGIIYADEAKAWIEGVKDDDSFTPFNWILAGGSTNVTDPPASYYPDYDGDAKGYFETVVDGTWGPYAYVSDKNYGSFPADGFVVWGLGPASNQGSREVGKIQGVDVVYTNDRSKWTRVPVLELCEDAGLAEGGARKLTLRQGTSLQLTNPSDPNSNLVEDPSLDLGWSYFPGYAISVETGQRLNMVMGENSNLKAHRGDDMMFNPTATQREFPSNSINGGFVFGGQHAIYVLSPLDTVQGTITENVYMGDNIEDNPLKFLIDALSASGPQGILAKVNFFRYAMWTSYPTIREGQDFDVTLDGIPTDARVVLRMDNAYSDLAVSNNVENPDGHPKYGFNTSTIATKTRVMSVGQDALETVRMVPNPYYGWSEYETSQLDNIVKITNLPEKCKISIYTTNGTQIRVIDKDNTNTWVEWDLKNRYNVPIASGVYIIHIDAGDLGEKVLKWFGALRPVDLNAF
jgi:hypothetical protein